MNTLFKFLVIIVMVELAGGCASRSKIDWRQRTAAVQRSYSTGDIWAAEAALVGYVRDLDAVDPLKERLQISYEFCLGISHGRLFLIYQRLNMADRAEDEYRKSVYWFQKRARKDGMPPPNLTHETLAHLVEVDDSTAKIAWKTSEIPPRPSNK